jgi:hypothetical protein
MSTVLILHTILFTPKSWPRPAWLQDLSTTKARIYWARPGRIGAYLVKRFHCYPNPSFVSIT